MLSVYLHDEDAAMSNRRGSDYQGYPSHILPHRSIDYNEATDDSIGTENRYLCLGGAHRSEFFLQCRFGRNLGTIEKDKDYLRVSLLEIFSLLVVDL